MNTFKYLLFREKFKTVDDIVDAHVAKSPRLNDTVYIDAKVFNAYPMEYWDYYMTTRSIFVQPKPRENRMPLVAKNKAHPGKLAVAHSKLCNYVQAEV